MSQYAFMKRLDTILEQAGVGDREEILSAYEEHFKAGYELGLDDAAIIASLGTPEEIYQSFVEEGLIQDTADVAQGRWIDISTVKTQLDHLGSTVWPKVKEEVLPQIPTVAKKTTKAIAWLGIGVAYTLAILIWVLTPAVLYFLGVPWQPPINGVTLWPTVSVITLVLVGGMGILAGLACFFVGRTLQYVYQQRSEKPWKQALVAAIFTVIFAVSSGVSFAVNDINSYVDWYQQNYEQLKIENHKYKDGKDHKVDKEKHDKHDDDDRYEREHMNKPNQPSNTNKDLIRHQTSPSVSPSAQPGQPTVTQPTVTTPSPSQPQ